MAQERKEYDAILEQLEEMEQTDSQQRKKLQERLLKHAQQHNEYRKNCEKARWELIVHRQAVGFIVGNHKYVTEKFPIAEALPEEGITKEEETAKPKPKKVFGDQLDWWQKIGRWR